MKKSRLNSYMDLPYLIIVHRIPKNEGSGYIAYMPELGRFLFCGDGDTPEEALKTLSIVKESLFKYYIKNGVVDRLPWPGKSLLKFTRSKNGCYEVERI